MSTLLNMLMMGHYGSYVWGATGIVFFGLLSFMLWTKKESRKIVAQLLQNIHEEHKG